MLSMCSSGHLLFKVSGLTEEAIPKDPSNPEMSRMKALPNPSLGVVRQVLGIVAPVGAVIVPEVVIRIFGGPDGQEGTV